MDRLPNVFQNPINKKINNTQDLFRSDKSSIEVKSHADINKKINEIFGSLNHVYKSKVKVTLKDEVKNVEIVGRTNTNLLTLDGKLIKIMDILDIERV